MDTFCYELLACVMLSEQEAKKASHWYRGAGWYMNRRDASGTVTSYELIAPAESDSAASGLGALNTCGREGWDVAAFVPETQTDTAHRSSLTGVLSDTVGQLIAKGIAGDASPPGDYFILKRRITN